MSFDRLRSALSVTVPGLLLFVSCKEVPDVNSRNPRPFKDANHDGYNN
jgi:hypothetical protein